MFETCQLDPSPNYTILGSVGAVLVEKLRVAAQHTEHAAAEGFGGPSRKILRCRAWALKGRGLGNLGLRARVLDGQGFSD